MVTENAPDLVGAPAILPVDALSVSPGGNEPPTTLQLLGSVFPLSPSRKAKADCTCPAGKLFVVICKTASPGMPLPLSPTVRDALEASPETTRLSVMSPAVFGAN